MLMTEQEAANKWCPMARDSNTGGNRCRYGGEGDKVDPQYIAEHAADMPCLGSGCAMWRWGASRYDESGKYKTIELAGRIERIPIDKIEVPRGFCGLAGNPSAS